MDSAVCGNIALNQNAPECEAQDIELPDEPDATSVPVDNVEEATSESEEAVEAKGEVSIQALTYVESLIIQAVEDVAQAEGRSPISMLPRRISTKISVNFSGCGEPTPICCAKSALSWTRRFSLPNR